MVREIKKAPCKHAEDEKHFPWYHLNLPPKRTASQTPIGPSAISGAPVFAYCEDFGKAAQKGIPVPRSHCLAPTGSSLRDLYGTVLGFFIAFV